MDALSGSGVAAGWSWIIGADNLYNFSSTPLSGAHSQESAMRKHVGWEGVFPAVTTQFRPDLSRSTSTPPRASWRA